MLNNKKVNIGLSLSGGGVRAAAFHSGVLDYLAEKNKLDLIKHISTVSGGSLFIGLVLCLNNNIWLTSKEYKTKILPAIQKLLTSSSLQCRTLLNLIFNPFNWRFILSRANVIALTIEKLWDVKCTLKDLPQVPLWSINGTTAENGYRFRVKGEELGDYGLGYTKIPEYKLAKAMAMSAAFPFLIGPVTLNTKKSKWRKRKEWLSDEEVENYSPPFSKLHLYDGGVYDNLGLEPLFDVGEQIIKKHSLVNMVIVSDASAPFINGSIPNPLNPVRARRVVDIFSSQTRALRVRSFVNFISKNKDSGAYLQLGAYPEEKIQNYRTINPKVADLLLKDEWMKTDQIDRAASYGTTLAKMREKDFVNISQHGYQTAKWNFELFNENF